MTNENRLDTAWKLIEDQCFEMPIYRAIDRQFYCEESKEPLSEPVVEWLLTLAIEEVLLDKGWIHKEKYRWYRYEMDIEDGIFVSDPNRLASAILALQTLEKEGTK